MNKTIVFEVLGEVVGKQEVQFNRKLGIAYKAFKTRNYQEYINLKALSYMQSNNITPFNGPIKFTLEITLRRAKIIIKNLLKKDKKDLPAKNFYPCRKPDSSNVLKLVEDALKGACYRDDMDICESHIFKVYGDEPKLKITIEQLT